MKNSPKYTHEQRPDYQRENIDLALKIALWIMSDLWIDSIDYDPNKIRYIDSMGDFWWIHRWNNKIDIDERFRFNQSVYVHEILHGLSTSYPIKKSWKRTFRSGYQKRRWANSGFNEWLTDILTLHGIRDNLDEVKELREKYLALMYEFEALAKKAWDPEYKSYSYGCENTWWYRAYFREMRLVDAIIDWVAYNRSWWRQDLLEDHQHKIFEDLVAGYFLWDFEILKSLLKEADPSWKLWKHIKDIEPGDIKWKHITDDIRAKIKDIFNPWYRMDSIPTKLG